MSVSNTKNSTTLVIRFQKGQNEDGTPKITSQKFSRINEEASDEDLLTVAEAIGAVLINEPVEYKKLEDFSLVKA